jgi:hypothetical protein
MEKAHGSPAPIGGGWTGADLESDPDRWRLELPAAVRDELLELAAKRAGRTRSIDDEAPQTSRTTAEFVSRLGDMVSTDLYFAVVTGFPYEPISTCPEPSPTGWASRSAPRASPS